MDSLTHPFWPEPAGFRGKPDGTPITITGELAYVVRHVSTQGRAYMTGVLRTADGNGEVPFEVPPMTYSHVGGLMAEAEIRTVTGRIDRRGPVHLLAVGDVEAVNPATEHAYLSTACLHGEHDYCSSWTRMDGQLKSPTRCKFCEATCRCSCHQERTSTASYRPPGDLDG